MTQASGALQGAVGLPTKSNQEMFDTKLQATITKKSGGGYELTDESGETQGTVNFDSAGKTQALTTGGDAKVNYEYEAGNLSEIAVEDPATFSANPEDLQIPEPPEPGPPTFLSAFGLAGRAMAS